MKTDKLNNMVRGWLIGDFYPSVMRTKDFEVGIMSHKQGENWEAHYHAVATEYNVLLDGKMTVNGVHMETGDIFVIEPNEIASCVFLEDCRLLCVKTPSVIGDKYKVPSYNSQ